MATPYENYIASLKSWLHLEDEEGISLIIATAIAVMLPGDPVWMFIIDPPGALKTEICRSLPEGPRIYTVDYLTPQALITGFRAKKGTRIDILPDLDGKLLVIKDFTTILSKPEKTRDELLGQLRSVYDGFYEQAYGSGVKKKGYHARFGILAAVTPVIEMYHKIHALLGERFLRVKTQYNREESIKRAVQHSGREDKLRAETSNAAKVMLEFYDMKTKQTNSDIPNLDKVKLEHLGNAISILRSPVARDFRREVIYAPEAEVGTRLGKQFLRLGQALEVLGQYKYSALVRCGWDCLSPTRKNILGQLIARGVLPTKEIVEKTRLSENTILIEGENMWMLEILNRDKISGSYYWSIEPKFEEIMKKAELI